MNETLVAFALFGLWTLACIGFGASLMHRKQVGKPPVPSALDALASLYERVGKKDDQTDKPKQRERARL